MPPGGWIFSYILQKVVTESTFNVFELEWKRIERMYIHLQPINPQMDVFGLWEVNYRFMTLISNWTASKLTLNQCADLFTNLLWRGMLSIHKMSWYSSYKYKIQNRNPENWVHPYSTSSLVFPASFVTSSASVSFSGSGSSEGSGWDSSIGSSTGSGSGTGVSASDSTWRKSKALNDYLWMACRALRIQPQQRNITVTVIKDMRLNCDSARVSFSGLALDWILS